MTTKSASLGIGQVLRVLRAHDAEDRTDGQLLERFLVHQDDTAFAVLVRRHGPMVLGVCRRILRNDADAEDAFQATFLVLVRKAPSLTSRSILGDWLHGVARYTALKAKAAVTHRQAKEQAMARPDATSEEPRNDWLPLLDEELARLPEKYRLPILLCDLEGKTRHEAAKQLGWPEGTVAGRLARARTMLAKALARHGMVFSGGALAVAISQNTASAYVPGSLVISTVNAASMSATGKAVAGVVSTKVVALTEEVMKAMLLTKLKIATAAVLVATLVAALGTFLTGQILAAQRDHSGNVVDRGQTAVAQVDPVKRDLERLQGVWKAASAIHGGAEVPAEKVGEISIIFQGEKLIGADKNEATVKLDPAQKPAAIDLIEKTKKVSVGIYEIDGDTLKFCFSSSESGEARPKVFDSPKGSKTVYIVMKRDKKKGGVPGKKAADPLKEIEDSIGRSADAHSPRLEIVAPGVDQKPGTPPAEQVKALMKEHQDLVDAFENAFREIKGVAQRNEFYWKNYPPPERLFPRLMALAEKYPKDAAAVDALIWVATHHAPYYDSGPKDQERRRKALETQGQALDWLIRDHLVSDKLPLVIPGADEKFLRAVLDKSPHRHIRGLACYTLAEQRIHLSRRVTRFRNEIPDWQQNFLVPKQSPEFTTDIGKVTKETETLLEQVVRDFADVPIEDRRNGKTLGELAKGHLREIRHLAIGMPAPELKSVGLDGRPVQLADLKGKVVVLDVWAVWCGPCKAMIPHQRDLVKRLDGKPFALVSISVDEKRETLAEFLKKEPMPWTHWYEGPGGKIIADLNVWSYPTIYVLDAKGMIRHKDLRGKLLDQAVDALLKEMEESPRR